MALVLCAIASIFRIKIMIDLICLDTLSWRGGMRQIFAYVNEGEGSKALELARELDGANLASFTVTDGRGRSDLVLIETSNEKLEELVDRLQKSFDGLRLTLFPQGVIALKPPAGEAADQAIDVTSKSPLEIFLGGLQSIGSWKGFLGYSIAGGIVAWIGLYTETVFLLIAAMLISPFAGPAMTLALGTARGDSELIRQSCLRYFTSIASAIAVSSLLTFIMGQKEATELMISISNISSVAIILALTAGAAGALTLCQSERDSLVTAAGPGMLVAASLAPPSGIVGISLVLGEWNLVKSAGFLLILQLIGINIAGSLIFYLFGLTPKGVRYERGKRWLRTFSIIASIFALGGVWVWQQSSSPALLRSSEGKKHRESVMSVIKSSGLAYPVTVDSRYTRSDIPNQNTLLVRAYVQKKVDIPDGEIKQKLVKVIQEKISASGTNTTALVDVTVLEK